MSISSYRIISLILALVFAIVGLTFLFMGNGVILFFNRMSGNLSMQEGLPGGNDFYVILGVGYMYLVTLLAYLMYRHPGKPLYPFMLLNGKAASSIISFLFFLLCKPLLIYLANGIVDGMIAVLVIIMYRQAKRTAV